ncbi:pseudouridylate synthase 7 homolog isoform X3 [Podarcis lilfordi]|uniref:Pseudouridylate synthase 7 homolog isoform X3 n=1 Tax=Podarcis lilfordi TaxID=74358 RepID=A0AA35KXZ6_9SAUR|nr:pseudouridylate synthase 7 homolog isoform X3 [Podarcis lilfordi]
MEEDSDRAVAFHSCTYVNDHIGFCGSLKTFPKDFVVTEINAFGQLVNEIIADSSNKSCESLSEQAGFCQQDPKRLRLSRPELCTDEEYCNIRDDDVHCSPECLSFSVGESEEYKADIVPENHLAKAVPLDSLLDKPLREQLGQFACRVKDMWESKSELGVPPDEFSLGPVLDKKNRASLHGAIRQEYPFLATVTKCGEIIVKANQDYQDLCQLVSEEEACGFMKFLDAKLEKSKFAFRPDGDKEHRKMVHHFISKKFGKLVETKSFTDAQQKVVIIVRFREKSGSRKRAAVDSGMRKEIYTAFTLRKENLETLEAISFLSAELGVLPSDFSYTGIKDKKAITYQAMVVKKVTPERLKELGNTIGKKGIGVSNVHSASQPLRLGQLQGNHFDIIVRDLKLKSDDCSASLKERVYQATENVKVKQEYISKDAASSFRASVILKYYIVSRSALQAKDAPLCLSFGHLRCVFLDPPYFCKSKLCLILCNIVYWTQVALWVKPQSLGLADQKVGCSNPCNGVSSCFSAPAPANLAVQKHVKVQVDK